MEYNDKTAKLLSEEKRYPNGANSPTIHKEYACPCGNGKIVEERVAGFYDWYAFMDCKICSKKFEVLQGFGHIWELREKSK